METENFYTTYNARHLAPQEVAESFIWSKNYHRLTGNNHSIILGARGCGKTTLMKMLTLPALHSWESPKAEEYRKHIPFYSIYVSTDIYWNVKNKNYGAQLEHYGTLPERVSRFAVNSNVFSSLCDTFLNIIKFEIVEDRGSEEKEMEIGKELIDAWQLDGVPPKIKYIKEALNARIDEVNQLIQDIIFNHSPSEEIELPNYFNLYFESSLERIIPKFERIFEIENQKKWGLCFDELEFAPLWLQKTLFKSLRSRAQFILYKLSASPILPSELENAIRQDYGPTAGNDVDMIKMWNNPENEEFSKEIILSLIGKDVSLKDFFGSNEIYNKSPNSYTTTSNFYEELLELYKKDFSFREFLEEKSVDLSHAFLNDRQQKDILFRKIKPIVYFRNTFIKKNIKEDLELVKRPRKSVPDLYYGIEVLSKVCDGNPRWLIGIVTQMLAKSNYEPPSKNIQYNQLKETANKFKNVIANIPVGDSTFTVENLIDRIGNCFKSQLLSKEFKMDPKGTFIVDTSSIENSPKLPEIIEKAVAQGALILLDADNNSFDFEIIGKRFKLSFLFSLIYDLPIRKYTPLNLKECMKGVKEDNSGQFTLFNRQS